MLTCEPLKILAFYLEMKSFESPILSMEKKDLNRLNHMLDAAQTIQKHIQGRTQPDLDKS